MKKIAIFGGAFDPITRGHIVVMDAVAPYVEQVWLLPAATPRYGKKMTLFQHRFQMCMLAAFNRNNVYPTPTESLFKTKGRTYDLIKMIMKEWPNNEFYFVIGQDNAVEIHKWYKWKKLIKLIPFIVVARPNVVRSCRNWYEEAPHSFIQNKFGIGGSSTLVRELIKHNEIEVVKKYIDHEILEYIMDNKLYVGGHNNG